MMDYEGKMPREITDLGGGQYLIQGMVPDSDWEVLFAIALSNAGWQYQYSPYWWLTGARSLQIDFRVFTIPKTTFVFLDGAVWHQGQGSQQDKVERLELYALTKAFANEPLTLTNEDIFNYDACWKTVTKIFGRK